MTAMESDSLDTKKRFFKFCTSCSNSFPGKEGRYFGTPDIEEYKQAVVGIDLTKFQAPKKNSLDALSAHY